MYLLAFSIFHNHSRVICEASLRRLMHISRILVIDVKVKNKEADMLTCGCGGTREGEDGLKLSEAYCIQL